MKAVGHRRCVGFGPARGFTLIELMVTIALAAILMMVAVPSFIQVTANARLSEAVSNFVTAANAARGSALKYSRDSYVVPSTGTDWSTGWFVFTEKGTSNQNYDTTDEKGVTFAALPSGITVTTPANSDATPNALASGYLRFAASGYPRLKDGQMSNGRIVFANNYRSRTVIFDKAGRVRTCVTGATDCGV